jgi:hypothetical protein
LWNLFVPEGGGSRNSFLGGGEFEILVMIANPIPAVTGVLGTMRKR